MARWQGLQQGVMVLLLMRVLRLRLMRMLRPRPTHRQKAVGRKGESLIQLCCVLPPKKTKKRWGWDGDWDYCMGGVATTTKTTTEAKVSG